MSEYKNPSVIAREALRRLAQRQLAPTPANFQSCYNEIAGVPDVQPFPEAMLREIAGSLFANNDEQEAWRVRLTQAIGRRSWIGVREAFAAFTEAGAANVPTRRVVDDPQGVQPEFAIRLARFVECVLPALGNDDDRINAAASGLIALLRQPCPEMPDIEERLAALTHQVLFAAEEQAEIKGSLLKLLHLVIENVGELAIDDSWLKGQIDSLLVSISPPLTLRHLDDVERRLRDVMEKQGRAKARSIEAQEEIRQMLTSFIERLATMNEVSTEFQGRVEESARQLERVTEVSELKPLLRDLVEATVGMAEETARSREHLSELQQHVLATEAELMQLHLELDTASALARHDPLTDALNRKGLDEALAREIANMRRKDEPLSLCLLDIDNFKKLNDRLGHEAGDQALIHLAEVARINMRPSDTLARYGGEEFIILMPDTTLQQGIEAMVRLQRELTKAFYLNGNERILITFSAGVAQLTTDENGADAIRRADKAMYLAKRAGKNRVMGA
jgi:diguanylate cyclase